MDILIIEDEAKTAKELKTIIERLDDRMQVVDILPSVEASLEWLESHPSPQLILSDIQLSDGLSFEIFQAVDIKCPVIFCTAFDSYAIQAFEVNGIDYLLKPVDEEKLAKSLQKYEQLKQLMGVSVQPIKQQLKAFMEQLLPSYKQHLLVFKNEKIIPLKTVDIAFIYSAGGIVKAYTKQNQCYLIREVLDELEPQLDPFCFFRANRQFMINRDVTVLAEHYFNRRLVVKLTVETPESIIVSKMKTPELLAWMEA